MNTPEQDLQYYRVHFSQFTQMCYVRCFPMDFLSAKRCRRVRDSIDDDDDDDK